MLCLCNVFKIEIIRVRVECSACLLEVSPQRTGVQFNDVCSEGDAHVHATFLKIGPVSEQAMKSLPCDLESCLLECRSSDFVDDSKFSAGGWRRLAEIAVVVVEIRDFDSVP